MKKLMIAAAAAAMIGGAYADLAYDYTASLKTTVGKGGNQTTVKVNLGMDDNDIFWYEDENVGKYYTIVQNTTDKNYYKVWIDGSNPTVVDITGLKVTSGIFADITYTDDDGNQLVADAMITFTQNKYGYIGKLNKNFDAIADGVKEIFANYAVPKYNRKSGGKWCQSFSYKSGATCYRAAGSIKHKAVVRVDDCCSEEFLADAEYDHDIETINFGMINRFGATTLAKACKIEVCGYVGDDFCDANSEDNFTLAGQGTWTDKLVKIDGDYVAGIKSISGNIVGVVAAPNCETCCQNPYEAVAWTCDGVEDDSLPSAAYGTWSLKFNKNK